jgi:hypothetical protein
MAQQKIIDTLSIGILSNQKPLARPPSRKGRGNKVRIHG